MMGSLFYINYTLKSFFFFFLKGGNIKIKKKNPILESPGKMRPLTIPPSKDYCNYEISNPHRVLRIIPDNSKPC